MFHFCNCLLCIVKENNHFFVPLALISATVGVFVFEWMTNFLQTKVKNIQLPFLKKCFSYFEAKIQYKGLVFIENHKINVNK